VTETADGSIPSARVFSLAISAFAVLAAEPLYLLVDTAVVGHLGTTSLGALGIGATILSLITLVGTFLEYGTTSRAARWFGAGRDEDAVIEGVQATWLAVIIGLIAVGLGEIFAGPLCRALAGGSGPIASHAESWLRVAICGVPGILIVLAGNGWLRGVQDTRSPVLIVIAANAASAIASPILVYPLGLGLVGSALANLGAQIIASVLFVRALLHRRVPLRPDRAVISAQVLMGRDLFLRSAAFQAAFLTSAAVAARMGTAQLGAHQIALQLWEFSALLLDAFAIAAQSLIGAALGGGDGAQARAMAWRVARYGAWAGLAFGVVIGAAGFVLPPIFTSSPTVIHQAHILWPWFAGMQPAAGLVFALDGVLLGAGDVAFMRTLTVGAALVAFVPLDLAALHWRD
jgi:putative MATE family efflux protein